MAALIGLDLGTTTVTGVVLDIERGEVLHLAQRRNDAFIASQRSTHAEQDPLRLRALALDVLAELVADSGQADGIAVTGQMHGLTCLDADGYPLTPLISWQDQRTGERLPDGSTMLERLNARLADLSWRENGCRIAHGYGTATLFWLVQQGELPPGTCRVCTIADWLAGTLSGQLPSTDPTLAASWGVYNLVEGAWNKSFLGRLGLDRGLFPSVRDSGGCLGALTQEMAEAIGAPVGIPVHNALGDTQASFLGAVGPGSSLTVPDEQPIFLNLGTGGQICWATPGFEPPSEMVETRPLPGDRYMRVGASLCGGAAYAWLNETVRAWLVEFGVDVDERQIYQRLDTLAAESEDGEGLLVRTTFLGVRGEPTIQSGAIEGITLRNLRLGPLAQATMIGMVDELRELYQTHGGHHLGHSLVVATGGGVRKNQFLPALIEKRFGLPVQLPPQSETAALGTAWWTSTILDA